VNATVSGMAKKQTEQVRLPADLMANVRATAPVLGESATAYVARVVREALKRDMPKAAKELTRRSQQTGAKEETE
jgi:peptidase E